MGIQNCKSCGTKFKYKDFLKKDLSNNKYLSCRNCGAIHEMKLISIFIPLIFLTLPSLMSIWSESGRIVRNNIRNLFPNFLSFLMVSLVYVIIIIALSPFISSYKLKDSDGRNK